MMWKPQIPSLDLRAALRAPSPELVDRAWRALIVLSLLLSASTFYVTARVYSNLEKTTDRTNGSLCTLRGDLERRVVDGEQFLASHPAGIPGISAATLRQSIDGQRRTVDALSPLDCPATGRSPQ